MAPTPTVSGRRGLSVLLLAAAGFVMWRAQLGAVAAFGAAELSPAREAGQALRAAAAAPAPDDRAADDRATDDRAARARPDGWTRRVALPGHVVLEPAAGDASPALMLVDLVLVPKHGHIFASALPSTLFTERTHPSTYARWAGPGPWERLAQLCAALPALELAVGSRVLRSEPCVPLNPHDQNLQALSLARFELSAETSEALRAELAANGPHAQIAVRLTAGGLYATIDPVSRAAGLFRGVRRPLTGREDEDLGRAAAWVDPLGPSGANPPEQLSVCMKHIHDSNPFMEDVVAHHEAQGVSHLYLSVVGPEIEREMAERLAPRIAAGFVTLVQLDLLFPFVVPERFKANEVSFWGDIVKVLFLNSCLHHAKQADSLVGAWDIDELVSIQEPGWSDPHLGRYIVGHFARWAPAAGHKWRASGPEQLLPAPTGVDPVAAAAELLRVVLRANMTLQPVLPLLWYCELSLSKFENHAPRTGCWSAPAERRPARGAQLAVWFPLRAERPDYNSVKGVVITANVQLLELHTHSFQCERNLLVRDSDGAALRVVRAAREDGDTGLVQRRRSIFPAIAELGMHHFTDVYLTRRVPGETYIVSEFSATLPQSLLRTPAELDIVQKAASSIECSNTW
jgi:hypothetical protein